MRHTRRHVFKQLVDAGTRGARHQRHQFRVRELTAHLVFDCTVGLGAATGGRDAIGMTESHGQDYGGASRVGQFGEQKSPPQRQGRSPIARVQYQQDTVHFFQHGRRHVDGGDVRVDQIEHGHAGGHRVVGTQRDGHRRRGLEGKHSNQIKWQSDPARKPGGRTRATVDQNKRAIRAYGIDFCDIAKNETSFTTAFITHY